MPYETFIEYIEQLPDTEYVFDENDGGIFEPIFNENRKTYDGHYFGAYKNCKERFEEGGEAATISDILDKLFPREKYRFFRV